MIERVAEGMRLSPRLAVGFVLLATVGLAALAGAVGIGGPIDSSEALLVGPSAEHPFGTDELGRDVLARMLHGAGTSLRVAFLSVLAATVVATALGLLAGFAGGVIDDLLLKLAETFQVIPGFFLALVAAAVFGPSLTLIVLVLAFIFFPRSFRMARGEAIGLRGREFVMAARAAGAGPLRILARHLLPGALPIVIVNASFQAGAAVLIEAAISFLGLGEGDAVSLGSMLSEAQAYVGVAWWMSVFPGLLIALTILGMNLVGDGLYELREARAGATGGGTDPAPGTGPLGTGRPAGRDT